MNEERICILSKEAVEHYKRSTGKPCTIADLAEHVFQDDVINPASRGQYLSQWQIGEQLSRCQVKHVMRIKAFTGYPLLSLIYHEEGEIKKRQYATRKPSKKSVKK